jgi:hypothetical protein
MLSVLFRAAFPVRAFRRNELRRSARAKYLIIIGLLGGGGAALA